MCFAENKTSAIVTVQLMVNSIDMQMICRKLQIEHKSFNTQAEKKVKRKAKWVLSYYSNTQLCLQSPTLALLQTGNLQ